MTRKLHSKDSGVDRAAAVLSVLLACQLSCAEYDADPGLLGLIDPLAFPARIGTIQTGQTAMAASTQTIAITPVNLAQSYVVCSFRTNSSNMSNFPTCQLAAADQVVVRSGAANANLVVRYYVVEFASGASVQRGSSSMAAGVASSSVAFESVNTARSFPIVYSRSATLAQNIDEERAVGASFSSSASLDFTRSQSTTAAIDIEWQVVQFGGANVQSGVASIGVGSTAASVAISAVNSSRAWLNYFVRPGADVDGVEGRYFVRGVYASSTSINFDRLDNAGSVEVFYYAVEAPSSVIVQNGTATTLPAPNTETIVDVVLPTAINTALAWPLTSSTVSGGGTADQDSGTWSGSITSSTGLRFQRGSAQDVRSDFGWTIVEFVP